MCVMCEYVSVMIFFGGVCIFQIAGVLLLVRGQCTRHAKIKQVLSLRPTLHVTVAGSTSVSTPHPSADKLLISHIISV